MTHPLPVRPHALGRRRSGDTAERILDAAERCFGQRGYDGTSLRHVAERVGIRIPSLYNHFPNKQRLYSAVLERGMTPILDRLARFVEADDEGAAPREALVAELMALLAERPDLPRLIQYELLAGGEQLAEVLETWLQPTLARGLAMLERTPAAASWMPEQLPLLLLAFFQIAIGHFTTAPLFEGLYGQDPSSPEAVSRQSEFFGRLVAIATGAEPAAAGDVPNPTRHASKENHRS